VPSDVYVYSLLIIAELDLLLWKPEWSSWRSAKSDHCKVSLEMLAPCQSSWHTHILGRFISRFNYPDLLL